MYNSEVKFVLNTSWQHENISSKMSLFHKRESMVVVQEKSFYAYNYIIRYDNVTLSPSEGYESAPFNVWEQRPECTCSVLYLGESNVYYIIPILCKCLTNAYIKCTTVR
jgi:hypothetical protein